MSLIVKLDDLTIGDLDTVEDISGATLDDIQEGNIRAKTVAALVFVTQRHANPDYTLEDALKVRIADVDVDARPTKASRASGI